MASNSTISIAFKLDGDDKGFKTLAADAEGLRKAMSSALPVADKLEDRLNFTSTAAAFAALKNGISQVSAALKGLTDIYAVQEVAEQKLTTVMRQRMGATDEEIAGIRNLAKEQQGLGVIGDEVQLSGAQQMATFLNEKSSIETLLPAMNDLIAQQKGLNATTQDAQSIGNLLGKAMQGQTDALKRVGISFSDAEANVLKYGAEEERAAMLAEVIRNNVGDMNAALAATSSGTMKQLSNTVGDLKEKLGGMAASAAPIVNIGLAAVTATTQFSSFVNVCSRTVKTIGSWAESTSKAVRSAIKMNAQLDLQTIKAGALAASQKLASAATKIWTGIQAAFNAVMSANPIAIVVLAIAALVAAVIAAYRNCEGFRKKVDEIWQAIKDLASMIINSLVKAFEWVTEKIKAVWDWLKKLLNIGQTKIAFEVEIDDPDWKEDASSIEDITRNIEILEGMLGTASKDEARWLNEQIKLWQNKASKIRYAADETKKNSDEIGKAVRTWHEEARSIREVDDNLAILQERFDTATTSQLREETYALIQSQEALKKSFRDVGEAAGDNSRTFDENAKSIKAMRENVEYWRSIMEGAEDELTRMNAAANMTLWQDMSDDLEKSADGALSVADAVETTGAKFDANADTLKGYTANISFLQELLQTASVDEAAWINKSIAAWNEKADAIRNSGKEEEKAVMKASDAMRQGYSQTKNLAGGIQGISDALNENGTVWEKMTGVIDSFLQIFDSVTGIIDIIKAMTQATTEQGEAEEQQGVIAAAASAQKIAASTAEASADMAQGAAANTAATGEITEAAAETFSAHASIPFVGIAIAAAAVASMIATMLSMPKLASGGLATGPTLAMVGEYSGAGSNPEVIAPLDKLRTMLKTDDDRYGQVEFRIEGRTLVGVLNRVNNLSSRR